MTNAIKRSEFEISVLMKYYITCIDYLWASAANPEGTSIPEAGIKNLDDGSFVLCQHGMDHQRAVMMIAECLERGVSMQETADHVQAVGNRYTDGLWAGCGEDTDWKRVRAVVL